MIQRGARVFDLFDLMEAVNQGFAVEPHGRHDLRLPATFVASMQANVVHRRMLEGMYVSMKNVKER